VSHAPIAQKRCIVALWLIGYRDFICTSVVLWVMTLHVGMHEYARQTAASVEL